MNTNTSKFKIRLGLFIGGGIILFLAAVFLIGKQKNLFNPVFKLTAEFYNVSGLQVGNNIRFSGINVGTVDNIEIVNDSTVKVDMLIKTSVKKFIRSDCTISIGSEGLIGDRILVISKGNPGSKLVIDDQQLVTNEPVETDAIMASLEITAGNAEIISHQLAEIMVNVNSGNGTLGRLIQDSAIAENFNQTLVNLKNSSKGLNENMEAAKHNFLLKGYFTKKDKEAKKKKLEEAKLLEEKNNAKKEVK